MLSEVWKNSESMRDEWIQELLSSQALHDVLSSDLFARAVTSALKTKQEVVKTLRTQVKNVLEIMQIPSRREVADLSRKIDALERAVHAVGKGSVKVSTLKKKTPEKGKKSAIKSKAVTSRKRRF